MTSSADKNRSKLLVLDLHQNANELKNYFLQYGRIESLEICDNSSSAVIQFDKEEIVDRLVQNSICLIGENSVRLRRFRLNSPLSKFDCFTLLVKSPTTTTKISETSLRQCFADYQSKIRQIDLLDDHQALITFRNYDCVDQILLRHSWENFQFERLITKIHRKTRWDQPFAPLTNRPVLAVQNPVVHHLISHIECLTKQLRDQIKQPEHCQKEIERLEKEIQQLKQENSQLKSEQKPSTTNFALRDISNRRPRSPSGEKAIKRRRILIHTSFE